MSVRDAVEIKSSLLTQSERKIASALLSDYPYAGLSSIRKLAERAEVSAPSVTRFVIKIGLSGYPEMQRLLLAELSGRGRSPIEIHRTGERIEGGFLNEFITRVATQMDSASEAITEAQFERICGLLADGRRTIFAIGGRASDTIARHLSFHLRQARQGLRHLPRDPDAWPGYLLQMKSGDILFLVDFRRYQPRLARLAQQASSDRKAQVVLMTDKWMSPATRHASEVLAVPIDTRTIWDSYSVALAVVEALATRVAEMNWDETRARIEAWDAAERSDAAG